MVPARRWWRWHVHEVIAGDRQFWLQEELDKKLKMHGLSGKVRQVNTIDELVRAWCGKV
jgi:hypothetical protein